MTGVPAGETADDYAGKAGDDGQKATKDSSRISHSFDP
jgi:hypothetical protein